MNEVFPSPPSLYLDYGGIWQAVSLEQHGPMSVVDCWANNDPEELVVEASFAGAIDRPVRVELAILGRQLSRNVAKRDIRFEVGATGGAERWSPAQPSLHDAVLTVYADDRISDRLNTALRPANGQDHSLLVRAER